MMPQTQTAVQMIDIADLSVEDAVDRVIHHAVKLRASDLFILANEDFYAISIRHLGLIRPVSIVSAELGKQFTQHIKANAGMDVAEHRHPADGRWIYESVVGDDAADGEDNDEAAVVDLRLSTIPTLHGEDMVIRLLSRDFGLYAMDELGFADDELASVEMMLDSPGGLVLCCGPTSSGKTATLYAALRHLHDGTRKINTIEDPIEFSIEGFRQSQINHQIDLGFSQLLKGVLRQSPDIIMIGEIRDKVTATTAVRAANSGHLVLSTIHAPVAAAAIESMRSLGVNNHFLATALRGVISQRLVRTLDPDRRVEYDISHAPEIFEPIKHLLKDGEGKTFYAPGAGEGQSGYNGRTGVYEVMPMTAKLRDLVAKGADTHTIRDQALADGMLDFKSSALLKVARGVTAIEEVFRVIPAEYLDA